MFQIRVFLKTGNPYLSVAGRYLLHGSGGFELDFQLAKLVHFVVFVCVVVKICGRKKSDSPQEKIFLAEVKKQKSDPELHSVPETIFNSSLSRYLNF